jgi:hypothetical protein
MDGMDIVLGALLAESSSHRTDFYSGTEFLLLVTGSFNFYQPLSLYTQGRKQAWMAGSTRTKKPRAAKGKRRRELVILYSCWPALDRSGSGRGIPSLPCVRRPHPQPLAPAAPTVFGLFLLVSCTSPDPGPALVLYPVLNWRSPSHDTPASFHSSVQKRAGHPF